MDFDKMTDNELKFNLKYGLNDDGVRKAAEFAKKTSNLFIDEDLSKRKRLPHDVALHYSKHPNVYVASNAIFNNAKNFSHSDVADLINHHLSNENYYALHNLVASSKMSEDHVRKVLLDPRFDKLPSSGIRSVTSSLYENANAKIPEEFWKHAARDYKSPLIRRYSVQTSHGKFPEKSDIPEHIKEQIGIK